MTGWREAAIGFEFDDIKICNLSVWKEEWRPVPIDPPILPHPAYPNQMHRYDVYEIGDKIRPVRFAASELSAGVWGFYVPA